MLWSTVSASLAAEFWVETVETMGTSMETSHQPMLQWWYTYPSEQKMSIGMMIIDYSQCMEKQKMFPTTNQHGWDMRESSCKYEYILYMVER